MKLSDITIITSGTPPKVVDKPSKETTTFLTFLLQSQVFNDFVDRIRGDKKDVYEKRSIDIVIDSMTKDLEGLYGEDKEDRLILLEEKLNNLYEDSSSATQYLAKILNLPFSMGFDFFLLIELNAFRDLKDPSYPKQFLYLKNIWGSFDPDALDDSSNFIQAIGFQYAPDKRELLNWIDENWDSFQENMKLLPKSLFITTDFKDLELAEEIYQLYKSGLTPTKILNTLVEKYNEYEDSIILDKLSLDFVKRKIKRFKKLAEAKAHYLENPFYTGK